MQRIHHRLELVDLAAGLPGPNRGRIGLMRSEVADRVVAPVVRQSALQQERLGNAFMHRQQLDRGHPEIGQVGDGRFVAQAGVRSAQLRRDARMARGEALDV